MPTQTNPLNDYKILLDQEKHPATAEDLQKFLTEHKQDNISPEDIKKFEEENNTKLNFNEIKSTAPDANWITAIISMFKNYTEEIKEYLNNWRLEYEALPNIQFKREKLGKNIAAKWNTIQEHFPEVKNFQTEQEFNNWAANLPPEKIKILQEKNISPNDAWIYKKNSN